MVQDASQIKEKILSVLKQRGPCLPVHISKEIGSTILFSSAFLSELVSEKKIKVSNMRVGSSPIYFLIGQENSLEKFADYLKSREKEAFFLLKENRFLRDSEQSPAIRVAIREIKDFALPFKDKEVIVWRYFLVPESEFSSKEEEPIIKEVKEPQKEKEFIETIEKDMLPKEELVQKTKEEKSPKRERKVSKKRTQKKDETFFSSVKDFISQKSIDLLDIERFGGKEIMLRVKENGEEKLLIAYNKNKITETDILKAAKKAAELKMKYMIIGKGGPLKKVESLISAIKDLSFIERIK